MSVAEKRALNLPVRSGQQDPSVCRDPMTRLIKALQAGGVALNAPAARQLVNKYFSSVKLVGSRDPYELTFKDMAGKIVCRCRHQQLQQLPLKHAAN